MDFVIQCETFVRLATVLNNFNKLADDWVRTIRFDNGCALATNREIMSVYCIGGSAGVAHITPDPVLIEQCRAETPFSSKLTITVNDDLKYACAKTSLGYVHSPNIGVWNDQANVLNGWRALALKTKIPAEKPFGGMYWSTEQIAQLSASSPSGCIIFEEVINCGGSRPTLVRDINDPNWFGLFQPYSDQTPIVGASLPTWLVA